MEYEELVSSGIWTDEQYFLIYNILRQSLLATFRNKNEAIFDTLSNKLLHWRLQLKRVECGDLCLDTSSVGMELLNNI